LDCFDEDLAYQVAIVDRCDLFLSPHTGFAFTALAVGTPWLTISGGRWFGYLFNHVPFRSVIPDPCFSQFDPVDIAQDGEDGARTPSMSRARILDDPAAIVASARELLEGRVTYEQTLRDYSALLRAHDGDGSAIWSIDGVHAAYIRPARRKTPGRPHPRSARRPRPPRGDRLH